MVSKIILIMMCSVGVLCDILAAIESCFEGDYGKVLIFTILAFLCVWCTVDILKN